MKSPDSGLLGKRDLRQQQRINIPLHCALRRPTLCPKPMGGAYVTVKTKKSKRRLPMGSTAPLPSNSAVDKQTAALVHYTAMCREIAHCVRVDEVKSIRDKAMALSVYAKQALNKDAERQAAEVRLRAEIRAGELLGETKKTGQREGRGGDRRSQRKKVSKSDPSTLKDIGITKDQSSDWPAAIKMLSVHGLAYLEVSSRSN